MDSLTVIPALYVLKDCPPGFSEILICVEIDIFLFHYGMEGFYAGILYRLNCQLHRHGYAIGIPDNLAAAQVHHGSQISPSLFLHMDVGNISTPFLMDGFCLKNHVSGYLLYHLGRLRGLHGGYIFLPRQTLAPVWSYAFGHALHYMVSRCH